MIRNETIDTILSRRSVRKYSADPISKDETAALLKCAGFAPSGLNNQPWRFAVIEDEEIGRQLSMLTHYSDIIASAPVLIAVFLETSSSYHREKDLMAIGACIQNILLAAHSMGIGTVWLGEILKNKEKVSEILKTPDNFELMAVIAAGRSNEFSPGTADRKSPDETTFKIE
ncbi:MAG: nitroreductase family protein [Methanosarcinales archaeon]|jgi:nitroreductase|nr:nitroreductase family protein [Methanosarcinales archaeon]